jgi:L-iditol 2-dehydrogenase
MAKLMKAAVVVAPGKVDIREIPVPEPKTGEILVRQHACAICTMEQRVYKGILKNLPYPGCWGHEVAGVVESIGPNTETPLKLGDHVVLGDNMFCNQCYYCAKGIDAACMSNSPRLSMDGVVGMFGMAEYAPVQAKRAVKVSSDMPFEEAAFAEPLSCVIRSANMLRVTLGETVLVIGAGTMGLLNALVANLLGAKVIVSEIDEKRREKALQMGVYATVNPLDSPIREQVLALNDGRGADVIIVAIGDKRATEDAFKVVGPQGRVMLFASAHPDFELGLTSNQVHRSGISVMGTSGKNHRDFWEAALLLSARKIQPRYLIEAKYPLEQAAEALERASQGNTYRIVLTM